MTKIVTMTNRRNFILGGTAQRDVWTMEPDEEERKRVVDDHIELFAGMKRGRESFS